jgi:RHS repeat-associated protein
MSLVRLASVIILLGIGPTLSESVWSAVGRTPGSFAVSPTGAATYTIPIWAPPGPAGMQPSIALTYNSQRGNSTLGVGWALSGLSSITRCNRTYAQDGAPAPIALSTADGLCLDGKRLRLTSGTYGQAGSTYQTEVADFSNVTAYGTAGNGPAYFTVKDRNGRSYQYGSGGYSQVVPSGSNTVLSWMLDLVSDPAGNTMKITYNPGDGSAVPNVISWTPSTHGSSTYNYTMTFGYGANVPQSSQYGYVAGAPVVDTNLLSTITIANSNTTVKQYVLSYQASPTTKASPTTGRDELTSVQECGSGSSNCLPPTTITYQNGQAGVNAAAPQTISAPTGAVGNVYYDFNGDGRRDLVYTSGSTVYVALATASGYGPPINTGIAAALAYGDVLGTGQDGILANNGNSLAYYTYNGSGFTSQSTGLPALAGTFALVDMEGNGLPDLVFGAKTISIYRNTSSGGVPSFNPTSILAWAGTGIGSVGSFEASYNNMRFLDFDGDGRQDLMVNGVYNCGTKANPEPCVFNIELLSQGTSFLGGAIFKQTLYGTGNYIAGFANWNSDACTDLILQNDNASTIYLSPCDSSPPVSITLPTSNLLGVADWDGDGRTDILVGNGSTVGVYESTGVGYSALISTAIPYNAQNPFFGGLDIDGDGLDEIFTSTDPTLFYSLNTSFTYYPHNGAGQAPDLLSSIKDGYGNSASPTYVSTVQGNYSRGSFNPTYASPPPAQYKLDTQPRYVVKQVTFTDPSSAANGTYQQTFWYYEAWMNLTGYGFSGFKQFQRYDSRTGIWETRGFDGAFPYSFSLAYDLTSHDQQGNQPINYKNYNYPTVLLDSTPNNQRWFVYFDSTMEFVREVGGTKDGQLIMTSRTSYTYDNYGNATSITKVVTDSDSGSPYNGNTWTTTTTNTPNVDTSQWCLSLLTQTKVDYSTTAPGGSPVTRLQTFTPDTVNCRYTQRVTEPNSSLYKVTEDLGYDSFGNINSDIVTGIGMSPRHSLADWGTSGQFPMTVTDASTAQTIYDYDFSFGRVKSVTDPNGLKTSFVYGDGFGRVTQVNKPDGTATSLTYNACAPPNTCDPLWRSFVWTSLLDTSGNTITKSVTTYDAVDRPIEVSTLSLTGSWSTVITNYDSIGRVASRTAPFFFGSTEYTETYLYDALNRRIQAQRPVSAANTSPQTTKYQYLGDSLIITDANQHAKTLVRDPNRWLRQTQDATGYTITLTYDAAGGKTGVSDSLGNPLWSGIVKYGIGPFTVNATDADLGPWSYTYDALGELVGWTDAKTQSFSAKYDALSRMTDRYEPDLYTHWTWGTSAAAHEIGQLNSVCTGTGTNPTTCTAASGYSEGETYDTLGRTSQRSIQIPGDGTYTYGWAYSATTGLLDTLTYPTVYSYALKLQYAYQNGILQSITNISDTPHVPLWTADTINPAGSPTQETLGNNVIVNHVLDAVTGWPSSITAGLNGGAGLQNNSYLFDNVGNLTQRQDNIAGTTENVYPDVLNRLDHTVGDTSTTLTYDSMGRLSTWVINGGTPPNANDYVTPQSGCTYYANAQPHAVRKTVDDPSIANDYSSYCYDANGNSITATWRGSVTNTYTWTSYNQPNLFTGGWPTISTGTSSSQFFYDHNHKRFKQVASYGGALETTTYIGGLLEKMTNASGMVFRHYVPAGANVIVYTRTGSSSNPYYYMTKDHLGSTAVVTSESGALVVKEKFAALGWNENSAAEQATIASVSRHGFTGQEGIDNLYAVNMNGRVYQPGRDAFLSPDPTISDPTNTLSYNRYAYVNYNPLTNTDPTGFYNDPPPHLIPDAGGEDNGWDSEDGNDGMVSAPGDDNGGDSASGNDNGGDSAGGDDNGSDPVSPDEVTVQHDRVPDNSFGADIGLQSDPGAWVRESSPERSREQLETVTVKTNRMVPCDQLNGANDTIQPLLEAADKAYNQYPLRPIDLVWPFSAWRGSRIHSYFAAEVRALGPPYSAEVSYIKGVVVTYGKVDSVRADAVVGPINAPLYAVELKSGGALPTPYETTRYHNNLPPGTGLCSIVEAPGP